MLPFKLKNMVNLLPLLFFCNILGLYYVNIMDINFYVNILKVF